MDNPKVSKRINEFCTKVEKYFRSKGINFEDRCVKIGTDCNPSNHYAWWQGYIAGHENETTAELKEMLYNDEKLWELYFQLYSLLVFEEYELMVDINKNILEIENKYA
jgi:hypothetical protein